MAPQRSKKTPADSTEGVVGSQNGAPEEDQSEPGGVHVQSDPLNSSAKYPEIVRRINEGD